MIKITKGKKPEVLEEQAATWTAEVQAAINAGDELSKSLKSKYNHPTVKSAILTETHGKCAYCESKVRHVAPGDIEHIIPKSVEPARWFEWDNLTLACPVCNKNKGIRQGFVDPTEDEPEDHFWFAGTVIFPRPESAKGTITESLLKLNRPELHDRRYERLSSLERLLRLASTERDPAVKEVLQEDLMNNETRSECEYAAMTRWFIKSAQSQGLLP